MKNSIFYSIIFSLCVIMPSCTTKTNSNNKTSTKQKDEFKILLNNDSLYISSNSSKDYNLSMTVFDNKLISKSFLSSMEIDVLQIIKKEIEDKNGLSLYATKHNNSLPIRLKIQSIIDTTILFQIKPTKTAKLNGSIRGTCSKLISSELDENVTKNTKRWLYRNKEPLPDSLVNNMVDVLHELKRADSEEYITTSAIPVLRSFNNKYSVSSNMNADYYILFACASQIELDDFIEEVVANNFSQAKSSPDKITTCHKNETISGFNCIMLIGINKDWTYQIQPMGVVSIDNIPPKRQLDFSLNNNKTEGEQLIFRNKIKVTLPENKPKIEGFTNLTTNDWGGNGVSCQVNFSLSFGGDVKSLTLVRSGNLAKWLSNNKKYINLLTEKSPYLFTYELHLDDGDNYIPIIVTDKRGNKTEYKMNIPASFTRHNPDVEINNNIDIY